VEGRGPLYGGRGCRKRTVGRKEALLLIARLRESHRQLTTALANSDTLKTEILSRAETVLKGAEARHAAGDISLAELLPVRRDWAAVQLSYLESLRDVMQAWAALSPYVGPQ
jgi:outer membrane protein TolC